MKTEIIGESTQEKEIDWSKVLILKSKDNSIIVLTNGKHDFSGLFDATVLLSTDTNFKIGDYLQNCWKESYKVIQNPITIKFSND
jgi:hypothetical protein